MARFTVLLRHSPRGWEWTAAKDPDVTQWWGYYKTRGHAVGAAKRSLTRTPGQRVEPKDFAWEELQ